MALHSSSAEYAVPVEDSEQKVQVRRKYILARTALQLDEFSLAELVALTGVAPKTVGTFVRQLMQGHLIVTKPLPAEGRGRPRKSYRLLDAGKRHLLRYMRQEREVLDPDTTASCAAPGRSAPVSLPLIRTYQNGEAYYVEAVVPGLKRSELRCAIEDNFLTLYGCKRPRQADEFRNVYSEFHQAQEFQREVPIPSGMKHPKIQKQTVLDGKWTVEVGEHTLPTGMLFDDPRPHKHAAHGKKS